MDRPDPNVYREPEHATMSEGDRGYAQDPRYSDNAPAAGQGLNDPAYAEPLGDPTASRAGMTTPAASRPFDPWNYREDSNLGDGADVVGYRVEAIDGHIGKIDQASTMVGDSYLVVDTGPWIFGRKVLLPAGTVNNIDSLDQKVYVDRTKAQIKDSPEFDPDTFGQPDYREKVGGYYASTYQDPGYQQPGTLRDGDRPL